MNRREALKTSSGVLAGAYLASSILLVACTREGADRASATDATLPVEDMQLMEAIADTLLPTTTSSPGAIAAGAGPMMVLLLTDCYEAGAVERMRTGLDALRERCVERCGGPFNTLSPGERESLVQEIDAEAVAAGGTHWFHLMRRLALQGYFSTEIGMTRALRYVRVPGHWTGCMTLEPGQPAWG
ncbi:MAG: gluconate 2-dehydrogenase subunit 3 family protein [Gemmatimonadota bacterium]